MHRTPQDILREIYGYGEFYPLQEKIIRSILQKRDTLTVMPTGVGKSICYQVPALLFKGLTIVISPLISLMKDQVEQLREVGVSAVYLNSSISYEEYSANVQKVKDGESKLLYLAPETLVLDRTLNVLKSVKVDSITVDEAHCISEWGHDFRPEYREIANIRRHFPDAVLSGFTATATPQVQSDIVNNLVLKNPRKFVASFDRKNLYLQIIPKRDSFQQTVEFLDKHPKQSGIIYCFSRKQVDELAEDLKELNFSVFPYHAGMSDADRKKSQELFIKDDVQIIVATIAFGMGINKPNVRFVIHHDLPKNIESYYQQIGRAGRDGLDSDCQLLFGYGDIQKINYLISQKENENEKKVARMHLDSMVKYCESNFCRRIQLLGYFGESYSASKCGNCDNCMSGENDLEDITIEAQKFLSCIKRTGEVFGANHISEILRGSKSEKVINKGHNKLSTYGIGNDLPKETWINLSRQFLQNNLITKDIEYGSLKVTDAGVELLKSKRKVYGQKKVEAPKIKSGRRFAGDYDEGLFEILRNLRKEMADKKKVPPYVIFHDRTLADMAAYFPTTPDEFKKMGGVGKRKLNQFGKTFMDAISTYVRQNNIEKKTPVKTRKSAKVRKYVIVGEEFNDGKTLNELEKQYKVKPDTIVNLLQRYVNDGNKLDFENLMENLELSNRLQKEIISIFEKEGCRYLKPVVELLGEDVDYIQLKLMRLIYMSRKSVET